MTRDWNNVDFLRFIGDPYQDHALDVNMLKEILQFQKLITETAKSA